MTRSNILILCTGNSCRSQMAEGLFRKALKDQFGVYSAGTDPKEAVHPLAVEVMKEIGIDISDHKPKDVKEFLGRLPGGYLIIVCDKANDSCPRIFPGRWQRLYWPFEDPAESAGTPAENLEKFREIRDQIRTAMENWVRTLQVVPGK